MRRLALHIVKIDPSLALWWNPMLGDCVLTQAEGRTKMETATRRHRPRILSWIPVVGVIVALVWGFLVYQALQSHLTDLSRTSVPGQVTVEVPQPESLTIFYEDPTAKGGFVVQSSATSTLTSTPVDLVVTGPSGVISSSPYHRDLRFRHEGRTVTAMATIEAPSAGAYTLQVSGDTPAGAYVSAGQVAGFGLAASFVGAIILFLVSLVAIPIVRVLANKRQSRTVSSGNFS
jgi:hypothetical protein